MEEIDKELLEVFREEVSESIDEFGLLIESLRSVGGSEAPEKIGAAFRVAHNIKGAARTVGVTPVEEIAHAIEDSISPCRESGEPPANPLLSKILEGITLIERIVCGEDAADAGDCWVEELLTLRASIDDAAGEPAAAARKPSAGTGATRKRGTAAKGRSKSVKRAGRKAPKSKGRAVQSAAKEAASREPDAAAEIPDPALSATSVRVDVNRLDRLMGYVGELLVTHARQETRNSDLDRLLHDFRDTLRDLPPTSRKLLGGLDREIEDLVHSDGKNLLQFGNLTDEIGASMKRVRMLPIASLAPQWRSAVRESANETGKDVRLSIEVGDIELDKHILDGLRDPLIHLLRNSVDHGLEESSERLRLGKLETGQILVKASMVGAMVQIDVSDDGAGFDADKIAKRALDVGIVDQERVERMAEEELLDLLFTAGFSTNRSVSRLSGRGVGLDVVRARVRGLGGNARIVRDAPQGGAAFRISVPLSLVSARGLLMSTSKLTYAMPIENVVRTMRVKTSEIRQIEGTSALQFEGADPIRLRWLAGLMGEEREPDPEIVPVVVVRNGNAQLGLVVTEVIGVEEFVTKRLPWNLRHVPGVAGAVIRGDGGLVVVVDAAPFFEGAGSEGRSESVRPRKAVRMKRVLVVDDSITSRTLERNILTAAGYDVTDSVNGDEAWQLLQESPYDLVVSDVEMPNCSGLELTRRIRSNQETKDLPVILVTSLGNDSDRAAGGEAGANFYIVKSRFEQRQLLEAVEKLI